MTLFSGGLDSLVGTLDQLAADASSDSCLIGHHDATLAAGDQSRLWQMINSSITPGEPASRVSGFVRCQPHSPRQPDGRSSPLGTGGDAA